MNTARLNPIMGMLLLLLVGVALALSFSANSPKTNLGQAQGSPTPMTPQPTPPTPVNGTPTPSNAGPSPTATGIPEISPSIIVHPTISWVPGPTPDPTEIAAQQRVDYLFHLLYQEPGTIIAQGTNATPVGTNGPTSYYVEEVTLPGPTNFEAVGRNITVDKVWRFVVTGQLGSSEVGALGWHVWIDNASIGVGAPDGQGEGIIAIVTDRTILREGAIISISYGNMPEKIGAEGIPVFDPLQRIELPETLHIAP